MDPKPQATNDASTLQKYNKLKKRYRQLQQEYSKVLESWEQSTLHIKSLTDERKFYKQKLEIFFKSQAYVDDQVFHKQVAINNEVSKPNAPATPVNQAQQIAKKPIVSTQGPTMPGQISGQ